MMNESVNNLIIFLLVFQVFYEKVSVYVSAQLYYENGFLMYFFVRLILFYKLKSLHYFRFLATQKFKMQYLQQKANEIRFSRRKWKNK